MIDNPTQIAFQNSQNPNAEFDVVTFEKLYTSSIMDHSPFEHHKVEFYLIIIIEKGKGTHSIDLVDYLCEKGTLLTVRKDQIHKFYKNPSINATMLLFTDEFLISYLEELEALKTLQLFNEVLGDPKIKLSKLDMEEVLQIIGRIKTEYFNSNDQYSFGIIRSELHILIAKLYRIKAKKNQIVSNRKYLSRFIEFQNLVESNTVKYKKVKDYARMIGVSTKTLNTITSSIVNMSAKEFIDDVCAKQIKRLLINTELSIKEVAYASGFEESTNFYKYFKRQTDITPEQFRISFR